MMPGADILAADREQALGITPVSREIAERLDRYVAHLLATQQHTNLIANSTAPTIWTRHVADSLQLLELAPGAKVWIDLGSGAGFPGIVIAAALAGVPGAHVHLVESNAKKSVFLREAIRLTGAPATVHHVRIEEFVKNFPGPVDVVTARALAPLSQIFDLARPLSEKGAQGLFLKGQDVGSELTEASKYWKFAPVLAPSRTSPNSRIVSVRHWEPQRAKR